MRKLFTFCFAFLSLQLFAATVTGTITDEKGTPLSFASITIKGTTKGVVANSNGFYSLELENGRYTITCHHVGYRTEEKTVVVSGETVVDFRLALQELKMPEVIIRRGEDPALEIMRQAIRKRDYYDKQVDSFTVDVYIKGLIRSRALPDRVFGQKVNKKDIQGIDSNGKGILFLSESLTKLAFKRPDKLKMEVVSSRQSGGGFGLSVPFFVNFYKNNVVLFSGNFNPRGFVSPLADGAFHYYNFHYEGNFFEGDRMINRIRVTPKRKNEPLFNGFVQIVDGEWRLHSLNLSVNKQYGLDLLDTVRITQQQAPVTAETWRTENQVMSFAANLLGFDVTGDFLNLYTNYDLAPGFRKKFFDRVLMKFDTAFNQHDSLYWSRVRPVPLEPDERHDFSLKDSLNKADLDSMYSPATLDSLRRSQKPVRLRSFFVGGIDRRFYSTKGRTTYHLSSLVSGVHYNTVEGVSLALDQTLRIRPRSGKSDVDLGANTRYGFNNGHVNAFLSATLRPKNDVFGTQQLQVSGGKRLLQFNRDNPIDEGSNSISTLFYRRNYLKVYEAWFGKVSFSKALESGLRFSVTGNYEDRIPLQNTTDFSFFYKERTFLPNHPYELAAVPFTRHSALVGSFTVSYQPGQYFIELPERKLAVGSNYPTFALDYAKGVPRVFGSTADFDKWKFSVYDDVNLRLAGTFKYRFSIGGFLNNRQVDIPDYTHFNGNQTNFNLNYLNGFQLAPYYRYSNTEHFYTLLHAEHHFNGLLTNKLPVLNSLKWNLVAGANAFYVNGSNYYLESFVGLENIFKVFRVDLVTATQAQPGNPVAIRIGLGGLLGNTVKFSR